MPVFAARLLTVVAMVVSVTFGLARAEDPKSLPPVTIEAPPSSPLLPNPLGVGASATTTISGSGAGRQTGTGAKEHERCVDVTIGDDTSFGCINERLKRKVDEVNPVLNAPPIDARSSDLKVGTVNVPAVQQQYGRNFGRSVVPFRPTTSFAPVSGHR